tara:strand:+ start:2687 stop:2815 length:129 start_codon:yes stop_codon:yes gene_type:complete
MSRGIFNQERTGRTEIIWLEGEGYGYWEDGLFYTVRILEGEE